MDIKSIDIEILEMNQDFIKVKLPFLNRIHCISNA